MSARVAILASGGGSNLQAILDHFRALGAVAPGEVSLVVSDRAGAGALDRARASGAEAIHVPPAAAHADLGALLREHRVDVVALAGYLRLVPAEVTQAYRGRILNVHPALLPNFGGPGMYGARVHAAVLDAGVRVSGATVHFVDEAYDRGPIIAQWPVPVRSDDTPTTLAARVLRAEHALYPAVVAAVCAGGVSLDASGRAVGWPDAAADSRFSLLP